MYILTVITKDDKIKRFGYSSPKDACCAAIRFSKQGVIAVWMDSIKEWVQTYSRVLPRPRRSYNEVSYGNKKLHT